jgi:CheY-like chemotaxis protein
MSKALILCVDDDAESLKIRQLLLQTVGYETLCATDASSGLQLFETNDVRIVISIMQCQT